MAILSLGGSECDIHACAHSMPFLSRHMGSAPGVVGMSGMHVQPFVPARSVRISIFSFMVTMAALALIASGAADMALLTMSSSVAGGLTGPEDVGVALAAVSLAACGGGCAGVLHAAA